MAKSRIIASSNAGIAMAASTHYYYAPVVSALNANQTEASGTITFRSAGVISNLRANVISGNRTSTSPRLNIQLNGAEQTGGTNPEILLAPGGVAVSVPGFYVDATHTLNVNAGDTISIHGFGGGSGNSNWTFGNVGFDFTPTTGTVTKLGAVGALTPTDNTTVYIVPGSDNSSSATQAEGEWLVKLPAGSSGLVLRNLYVRASADTRSVDATISVNGASGAGTAPNVVFHNGGAAIHEDTSNSKIIADGDKISFKIVMETGTGALTLQEIAVEVYDATYGVSFLVVGKASGVSITSAKIPLAGLLAINTTESKSQATLSFDATLSFFSAYVKTTNNTTITLRESAGNVGSPGNVAVVTTGAGWVTDATNSYAAASTAILSYNAVRTTTPVITCMAITVQIPQATVRRIFVTHS